MKALLCLAVASALTNTVAAQSPRLWISDDVNKTIYETSLDGSVVHSSFASGSISGLCVDPTDDTLWAAKEGSGLLMHFDRLGNTLGTIVTSSYDGAAGRPEGIAIDYFDDTIWVVDDEVNIIYNLLKDGTLLDVFPTNSFDAGALSPQSIAADPTDGTLWITDNASDCVYNITPGGALLSAFPSSTYGAWPGNPQGISVLDDDGTLWVSDRYMARVYNIERDGTLISSFDTTTFGSHNPTGVAYDSAPGIATYLTEFGAMGLKKVKIRDSESGVVGNVGLAPHAKQDFKKGFILGELVVDPTADNSKGNSVEITGGTFTRDLSAIAADMQAAADELMAMPVGETLGTISSDTTLYGGDGLNVIRVKDIFLWGDRALTLNGGPGAKFVIDVEGKLKMKDASSIRLEGGVDPRNVVINMLGKHGAELAGASQLTGTVLSAHGGKVKLSQSARIFGAALGTGDIEVKQQGQIVYFGLEAASAGSSDSEDAGDHGHGHGHGHDDDD